MKYAFKTTRDRFDVGMSLIKDRGGKVSESGIFEVSGVKGIVLFDGEIVHLNITDKPWLASWDMIEDNLNEFFN